MSAGAPRLARVLVGLASRSEDRPLLLADLDERFGAIKREGGLGVARRWYWSQALRGTVAWLRPDLGLLHRRTWEGTLGDVRQGVRVLIRRPLYTAGVAGTLALGLASAAAVLSVGWHVWLAPMPFPDPDRVARLYELDLRQDLSAVGQGIGARRSRLSPPLVEDLRTLDWTTVTAVAGVSENVVDWAREDETSRVSTLLASPELFDILGIVPIAGRTLSEDADAVEVVLTEPFWQRAFGADVEALGGTAMMLGGVSHTVVGVVRMPPGYPDEADAVTRLTFDSDELVEGMRGARYLDVVARVNPGHTVAEASAEMNRIMQALGERHPNHGGWGGEAVVLADDLVRPYRGVLTLLLAAGGVFLLLAVVNVGGLVSARAVEVRPERAIRLALGASERRLLRGALIESVLLGAIGGGVGLVCAYWLLSPVSALVPQDVPRLEQVRLSAGLGGSIILVGLVSGLAVGLLGFAMSRGSSPAVVRGPNAATSALLGRRLLVVGQVALTTLLATAGAGVLRQVVTLQGVDTGFRPEGVAASPMVLMEEQYPTPEARRAVWRGLLEGLQSRGLKAAIASNPPMSGSNMHYGFRVDAESEQGYGQYHSVSAEYFGVMGIEVVEGRVFGPQDDEGSEAVLVVNEALARERFAPQSAVGREIDVVGTSRTIIGVVRSTRHFGPDEDAPEELYVPLGQDTWGFGHVLVRDETGNVQLALASVAPEVDPALVVPPPHPYTDYVRDWYAALRLQLVIVGVLALVGTTLAALGLYALFAYYVSARQREIGVRMALGASSTRMFSDVVRQGIVLVTTGLIIGFGTWYLLLPLTSNFLGDVDVRDPGVSIAVAVLVGAVATLASAVPAWRTVGIDPAVTLRSE